MTDLRQIESLVAEFGEQYRSLIISTLHFLNTTAPSWGLKSAADVNRSEFISGVINDERLKGALEESSAHRAG